MDNLTEEFFEVKDYIDNNLAGLRGEDDYMDVVKGITKYYAVTLTLNPNADKRSALQQAVTDYFTDLDQEFDAELDYTEARLDYINRGKKFRFNNGYYADELEDNEDETIADIQGRHL